jgi:hypothetical protein
VPAFKNHNGFPGVPNVANFPSQFERFAEVIPLFEQANMSIVGMTRDNTGAALGNCTVYLFRSDFIPAVAQSPSDDRKRAAQGLPEATPTYVAVTTSDGSGNFTFANLSGNSGNYFTVAWSAAGTVAGITLKTLVPA